MIAAEVPPIRIACSGTLRETYDGDFGPAIRCDTHLDFSGANRKRFTIAKSSSSKVTRFGGFLRAERLPDPRFSRGG
jgi:hypothetical protein